MKSLLEFILIHLVNNPDSVSIETYQDGNTDVYVLNVAPEDTGRIIGRSGKIIHAIRTLAKVRAVKEQRHVVIKVGEQELPSSQEMDLPVAATEDVASEE